ncbi:lipopolysaccharide biosynthesis protein [Metasolibacillus sp.]|uniref:lipopolysaccharide biosynthesis protein n=1 Tax=Metasolibacillus sp. TaxID=2703680 RepID=UPI0025E0A87C|nr:lipopolysaccharide biosynthesis protein [Metasolibacillus sp.]
MNISKIVKNISILMTGTVVAQLIPILLSPILTRLYSPKEFGMLAVFISITSILTVFANLRLDVAILSAHENEKTPLKNISLAVTTILTIMISLILIVFSSFFKEMFSGINYNFILFFGPLFFILFGTMQLATYIANDESQYHLISKSKVDKNISMTFIQIILGIFKTGVLGLIAGVVFSILFPIYRLRKGIFRKEGKTPDKLNYFFILKKYKRYPLVSANTAVMDKIATESPILMMNKYQDSSLIGFYELARRTIFLPLTFISTSVSQVYLKQITEENDYKKNVKLTLIILGGLVLISIVIAPIFIFGGEPLFAFIFGEEWRVVGEYSEILIFPFLIRFVISPLSVVFLKPENILLGGLWQFIYMIVSVIVALVYLPQGMMLYLKAFAISEVLIYILYLIMIFVALNRGKKGV